MSSSGTVLALAALALIESLLLELREKEVLGDAELAGLLDDVVDSNARSAREAGAEVADIHRGVRDLVATLRDGSNSIHAIRRLLENETRTH